MRIITKYLVKELMGPFLFGVLAFSGMFLGSSLVNVIQWAERFQVPFWSILKLWFYTVPENMAYGVYIGILLATLLGLGRLTSHSETIAMQAGGVSFLRIATPVLLIGLAVSGVSFFLNETIAPAAKLAYRQERAYLSQDKPKGVVEEYFYNEKGKNGFQRLIYAEKYYVAEERFINIMIQEVQDGNLVRTIKSKELLWGDEGWYFKEGEIFYYREDSVVPVRVTEGYNPSGFEKTPAQVRKMAQRPEEMSWWDLRWYLKNTEVNAKTRRRLEVQLHLKTAFPFACFIFALLGTPLALQSQRRTASAGLGICLINVIFYYLLMSLGTFLGQTGVTPPWVGAWLQNIVLGSYGGYLFIKKALYLS
ncbi:MAG: YjgP/YjgQ family permease [Firmicutes bacterium]|nr:YjgP/YjgQ family permease [Bacillota bacterium]